MKKTTIKLLAAGMLAVWLLPACSSETTTGTDETNVNTGTETMETDTADTYPDTTYQNPPTQEGNQRDNQ